MRCSRSPSRAPGIGPAPSNSTRGSSRPIRRRPATSGRRSGSSPRMVGPRSSRRSSTDSSRRTRRTPGSLTNAGRSTSGSPAPAPPLPLSARRRRAARSPPTSAPRPTPRLPKRASWAWPPPPVWPATRPAPPKRTKSSFRNRATPGTRRSSRSSVRRATTRDGTRRPTRRSSRRSPSDSRTPRCSGAPPRRSSPSGTRGGLFSSSRSWPDGSRRTPSTSVASANSCFGARAIRKASRSCGRRPSAPRTTRSSNSTSPTRSGRRGVCRRR